MIASTADLDRWERRFATLAEVPIEERRAAHAAALADFLARLSALRCPRPVRSAD